MSYQGEAKRLCEEMSKFGAMVAHVEEVVYSFIDPSLLSDEERGRLHREIFEKQAAWREELRILDAEWALLWGGNEYTREGRVEAFRYACLKLREDYKHNSFALERTVAECRAWWSRPLPPSKRRARVEAA